jgi:ubiquinone/menaquinone biosynthesis C-methylase UbiE/glycosyltransferase involved in cell wall biosynthesis
MNKDSENENQLPWTGERYVPQMTGEIQLEHVHRYLLAAEYAKDKDVLDIACGEGFGSGILANTAQSVVGVDIAADAIRHAATRYPRDNIRFRQGSCAEMPLDNNSIDLVVSFETIEHHDEHKAMMAEIKRVLRPEGILIISSPDKKEYSVLPNYRNPFHVKELFKEEFEDLIRAYFKNLALLSQRIVYGSGILPEAGAFRVVDYDINDTSYARPGLARARYLIAVACDELLPVLSGGLLEQTVEESEAVKSYAKENERRSEVVAQLGDKVRQLEEQLRSESAQSGEKVRRLEEQLRSESAQSGEKVRRLEEQLRSESAQSAEKVRQLEEQLGSQSAQSEQKVRQLEEQLGSESAQSEQKVRQLEEQLGSESARSGKKVRQLEEQLRTQQSARSGKKARQLEEQLRTQSAQAADKIHLLEEQVARLNLALDEARRLCRSMNGSLSWRLTLPLRVLRDGVVATLKKVRRRDNLPLESASGGIRTNAGPALESVAGSSDPHLETDPGAELLLAIFDESHYLSQVPAAADSGIVPLEHYRTIGWREGRDPHPLFDVGWYLSENRDVAGAGAEPLQHYLEGGWKEGRNPHPLFDVKRYLAENGDVTQAGVEPLSHYCKEGWQDGRDPHPLFDVDWYLSQNPDVAEGGVEPLQHYLEGGWKEGRSPHPLFDLKRYLAENADLARAGVEPLSHYCKDGWREGRNPHALFDVDWYLSENSDVAEAGAEPLQHYLEEGWKEGRNPHPLFDVKRYLAENADVTQAGVEPLSHYCKDGWREGRDPHALFDVDWYLSENSDVAEAGAEPLQHYLEGGWKEGRNPHPLFDVKLYLAENADVARAGVEPLSHYCKQGWKEGHNAHPVARIREAGLDQRTTYLATLIRTSAFFDAGAYDAAAEARAQGLDPALHYVLVGEAQGLKPSAAFDPVYYGERYPDIAACGTNRLGHYLENGRAEGRRALPIADSLTLPLERIKLDRPTVLILVHDASRTGAPILSWNITRALSGNANIVAILMRRGPLEGAFGQIAAAVVSVGNEIIEPAEASRLARRLAQIYRPLYAIANSVETRVLVPALTDEGVPVVALVHEFSGYIKPAGTLQPLYERAAEIVFSADIVRRSSEIDYPFLRLRRTHLLPQGPTKVPRSSVPADDPDKTETEERRIRSRLRPEGAEDDIVVVGIGFVDWRKGVDLFIATATAVLGREPHPPVRFIWVGEGYRVSDAVDVSCYLSEQVTRSRLGNRFEFMDAVEDVESIYKEADIFFLSSRLDPLPNVAIDAVLCGMPVVCFAEASGIAEILASNVETRELVVPHLDVGAAAALIGSLAADDDKRRRIGDATRELCRARFDLGAYVVALDKLGRRARQVTELKDADAAVILAAGAFDPHLYLGARASFVKLTAAVREYSTAAGKIDYERIPVSGAYTRRPLAGFNPFTYALQCPTYNRREGRDPLAHYLRARCPKGPWLHPVLRIEAPKYTARTLEMPGSAAVRVVLHGHFHYTDHVGDLMRALAANVQACQLILTTTSAEKAAEIEAKLRESRTEAEIRVVPNRGRDVAPFLTVLEEAIGSCDLLGHVHGKRSLGTPKVDMEFGDRWRVFLWQHLIGDATPMADIITRAFMDDSTIGLVFPEDPFLIGWEENLEIAQGLARRMDLRAPLPPTIDFPVGTMFWARPEALAPLLRLGLTWDEYPDEPLPHDATLLHALERLLVPVVEDAGFHYATTYVPPFVR